MYLHAAEGGHGLALVLLVLCGGVLVGAVGGGFWARRKRRGAAAMLAPRVTADIAPAILTPTVTVSSKTYDGTHAATITGCTLGGAIGGDVVGCSTAEATATFTSADAGDGIRVEVTGLALTGWDADNYVLASTAVTTTADIAPAILTPTVTVSSKTYDGTHAATITGCTLGGAIGGDVVGCSTAGATATFTSPDAGDAIRVEVTGLALTGWDAGNYVLASTAVTTTPISPRPSSRPR